MRKKLLCGVMVCMMAVNFLAGCSKTSNTPNEPTKAETGVEKTDATATTAPGDGTDATAVNVPDYMNATGFPIVKEPITLTAMVVISPAQPIDWNEILVWQEYEKMTGIHIEWEAYTSAEIGEKRNLALASGEMPDLFFRAKVPDNDISKYGADGAFLELSQLIEDYAPNYKAITEKYPDVASGVPMADGSIYALPNLTDSPSIEITSKLFMNKKWLEATGKTLPTTTEELYDVLTAFRNGDPNGNGLQDEIPLTSDDLSNLMLVLRGAFGLGNEGVGNGNWDLDPATGELRFFPASESYKEMLAYFNRLYSEKLIDQEIFTNDGPAILSKNEQELIGGFSFANVVSRANSNADDFVGLETALAGPNGDQLYTAARGHIGSRGAFLISSNCQYPEAAMRWVDYFYSEEGTKMLYLGIEGVSYQKNADGTYDFLSEIVNNIPEGSSFDQVVSKYVPYAGGSLPTIIYEDFFKGGETQPVPKAASANMAKYLPKELWAPFSFTTEESEAKLSLETDITSLVNQRTAEFVQGKVSLDEFDSYVDQLNKMGLEDLKALYNEAYTRYRQQ